MQKTTKHLLKITILLMIFLTTVGNFAQASLLVKTAELPKSLTDEKSRSIELLGNLSGGNDSILENTSLSKLDDSSNYPPLHEDSGQLVIGVKNVYPEAYNVLAEKISRFGGVIMNNVSIGGEPIAIIAELPPSSVSLFAREVQASGLARYVESRIKFEAQFVPNDPYYAYQWALPKIEAGWAWNTTTGNSSITVAVIDTGVDYTHPDLVGNYVPGGIDWVNIDPYPMDDNGHGTHCAGIIAAVLNNNQGIAGLAQVKIMAEKGLDYTGTGYDDVLANAIIHAVDQGANITSNSWGSDEDSHLIHDAILYAYNHSVLVVAAAGNNASARRMYPAAYNEVIAATATDSDDKPAGFTSYGDWVELAAPGVNIYSTSPGASYAYKSGTSMACPHVAGVAALVWSQFPNATRDWVRARLRYSADDLGQLGFDKYYGYGRINARKAIEQHVPLHDLAILEWEKPRYVQPGDTFTSNVTVLNFGKSAQQDVMVQLLVEGNVTASTSIERLETGGVKTVNFSWSPMAEGDFNVTVYVVPVPGETETDNNRAVQMISVHTRFYLSPDKDTAGAKVIATGFDFPTQSQVTLGFNDVPLGFALVDDQGSFTFTFNIPFSNAGVQTVKATDAEGNSIASNFTVVNETPLDIKIDVGTTYYIGQTAEFYAQTTFEGVPVNSTITGAVLHKPDRAAENLTVQQVATGLYRTEYTVAGNKTGTYTLIIEASYVTDTIQAKGASLKCFEASDTLPLIGKQVAEIKDGIATVLTDLGSVKLNLTAINATLEDIFLNVTAIKETTATIQTTIGTMEGKVTSMNETIATIVVPGLGQIEADVSKLKESQGTWTLSLYIILLVTIIAAFGAWLSVTMMRRKKGTKIEANAPPLSENIQ